LAAGANADGHAEEPAPAGVTADSGAGQRVSVADEFEIARVLGSKSDLECLKVGMQGVMWMPGHCRAHMPALLKVGCHIAAF
jgi:hypothetical protein